MKLLTYIILIGGIFWDGLVIAQTKTIDEVPSEATNFYGVKNIYIGQSLKEISNLYKVTSTERANKIGINEKFEDFFGCEEKKKMLLSL